MKTTFDTRRPRNRSNARGPANRPTERWLSTIDPAAPRPQGSWSAVLAWTAARVSASRQWTPQ
jgi:hypothetical protein